MKPSLKSALLLIAAFSSGCRIPSHTKITLVTNRTELVEYSEAFNAAQEHYQAEIHYRERPSDSVSKEEIPPDLVVSDCITGKTLLGKFHTLNNLLDKKNVTKDSFYPALLAMGQKDKQQMLIPLSFDLPLLMYDNRLIGEENGLFSLDLDKIREIGEKYNKQENGRTIQMGFSPRWDPAFLYHAISILGADFTEGSNGPLSWNERGLRQAMAYIDDWSEKTNGGENTETFFAEKYLYDPPYRWASLGRVKFAYSKASDFFLLPENRRLSLDFRWVSLKGRITALECVLFAGIPLKARNPRGAEAFLLWLLDPGTQKKLLEDGAKKTGRSFGIASGFSSIKKVNEREFPRLYPLLAGHTPPADILAFPPPLPGNWKDLKDGLLIPWMTKKTGSGSIEDLETFYKAWLLKHTD